MLTKADDYPIHQTPDPIAYSGTDRNFYDRYFFNGYSTDGEVFFASALGVYPHLNIMDAAFAVRLGDVQYNIRASRHLNMERMDTQVGPIRVEVLEPLKRLRVVVEDNEHGVAADLVFEGRLAPFEEPRNTRRNGPRTLMDVTRMTQLGGYVGWIKAGGHSLTFEPGQLYGTRDRSWGVRPIGLRDPQATPPEQPPQIHWIWVPATLEDRVLLYYLNEDGDGVPWNVGMMMYQDGGEVQHFEGVKFELGLQPGARWPARSRLTVPDGKGGAYRVELEPERRFYLGGVGYMHPEWGHGMNKGPLAVGYDEYRSADIPKAVPPFMHVQCFTRVTLTTPEGAVVPGVGAFELLSMGRHAPLGLTSLIDIP